MQVLFPPQCPAIELPANKPLEQAIGQIISKFRQVAADINLYLEKDSVPTDKLLEDLDKAKTTISAYPDIPDQFKTEVAEFSDAVDEACLKLMEAQEKAAQQQRAASEALARAENERNEADRRSAQALIRQIYEQFDILNEQRQNPLSEEAKTAMERVVNLRKSITANPYIEVETTARIDQQIKEYSQLIERSQRATHPAHSTAPRPKKKSAVPKLAVAKFKTSLSEFFTILNKLIAEEYQYDLIDREPYDKAISNHQSFVTRTNKLAKALEEKADQSWTRDPKIVFLRKFLLAHARDKQEHYRVLELARDHFFADSFAQARAIMSQAENTCQTAIDAEHKLRDIITSDDYANYINRGVTKTITREIRSEQMQKFLIDSQILDEERFWAYRLATKATKITREHIIDTASIMAMIKDEIPVNLKTIRRFINNHAITVAEVEDINRELNDSAFAQDPASSKIREFYQAKLDYERGFDQSIRILFQALTRHELDETDITNACKFNQDITKYINLASSTDLPQLRMANSRYSLIYAQAVLEKILSFRALA